MQILQYKRNLINKLDAGELAVCQRASGGGAKELTGSENGCARPVGQDELVKRLTQ